MRIISRAVPGVVLAVGVSVPALAAPPRQPISWGTATAISGDGDVRTDGTLVAAVNFGDTGVSSYAVNGVTFTAFASPYNAGSNVSSVVNGIQLNETDPNWDLIASNSVGANSGAFSALGAGYRGLLGSAAGSSVPGTLVVIFGQSPYQLTIGRDYLIQLWVNVSSSGSAFGMGDSVQVSDNALTPSSVTLDSNLSDSAGALGQYVVGTFTATWTTAQVRIDGLAGAFPLVNAMQIRDITGVPAPGALGLLAIAGLGRRRRAS